jgi:hypothetical protein
MSIGPLLSLLKAVACGFAAAAVLARLPRVVRRRRVDIVWVGTVLAAAAFSTNGIMFRERDVDAWLGGENLFHLVRNVLALSAVWCLRVALVQSLQRRTWSRSRTLREAAIGAALLLGLTAAFLSIDSGPTSGAFIPDHLSQPGTLVYALLIMAMGGWNAADVARVAFQQLAMRQSQRNNRLVWPALFGLGVGGSLLVLGCVLEAGYAILGHAGTGDAAAAALRASFGPVFLPGAVLVCLVVAWLGVYAQGRRLQVGPRLDILRIAPVWAHVGAQKWSSDERPPGWRSAVAGTPQRTLYSAVIAIEDSLRAESVSLSQKHRRVLQAAERRFELTS